ncbi:MAG: hypothetical protein DSY82_04220 [Flavobacteriia bacterium]|nr:MAG: hypothetical protein DSY82_04220 [Flavobacteriia bacterium]
MKFKKLKIFMIFLLFAVSINAQLIMIDSETGEYQYDNVVKVDGVSKQELLKRAKEWINLYYKDPSIKRDSSNAINKVVEYEFKWKFISKNIPIELIYDLEIKVKDNKYKYTISNLRIGRIINDEFDGITLKKYIDRFPVKYQINIEEPVDTELMKAIESLEKYMKTQKYIEEEDDW